MARAKGFNRTDVNIFFKLNIEQLTKFKLNADRIYNLDETGLTSVQKLSTILALKGSKQVGQISSSERDQLVTICCCVNGIGQSTPPVIIFLRVNFKNLKMLKDAPPGDMIGRTISMDEYRVIF